MSQVPYADQIREGEAYFEAGNYEAALEVFQDVLAKDPENPSALNDAGLTAAELGQFVAAAECFEQALTTHPQHTPAFFNLIDLLANEGEVDLAREAFQVYETEIPDSEEKKGYREVLFNTNGHPPDGAGYEEQDLRDRLQKDATADDVLKVGFVCGPDLKFITDIEERIAERHHVKTLHFGRFEQGQLLMPDELHLPAIQRLTDWADVVWFEWCDQVLVHASNQLRKTCKVVCRLHGYEVFAGYPSVVNWSFVDRLAFVAQHKQDLFNEQCPNAAVETEIIRNGVDLDRFTPPADKSNTKNLVLLGNLNYRKGLPMLLQFYSELLRRDDEYHLYIRGQWQDRRYRMAVETMIDELGLQDDITFVTEWIDDLNAWLADKSHILSFSLEESFHYAVGEAMAAGLKPVVHAWRESREIWPEACIFRNLGEFMQLVQASDYEPETYRAYVEEHYALSDQLDHIDAPLTAMCSGQGRRNTVEQLSVVQAAQPANSDATIAPSRAGLPYPTATGRVSIVIATLTIDYLRECLASIEANTAYPHYRIIIVNDGSKEPDLLRFLETTKHRVVQLKENVGFARANNAGFRASTGEYVMTLNADTLVHEGWLTTLVNAFEQGGAVGAVAPTVVDMGTSVIQSAGSRWDNDNYRKFEVMHQGEELIPEHVANTYYEVDGAVGVCLLFRRAPLFEVGLFDENYLNGWEDLDLCMELLKHGYSLMHAPAVIWHKGSFIRNTFEIEYYRELVSRNRKYFLSKWEHYSIQQHELVAPETTPHTSFSDHVLGSL